MKALLIIAVFFCFPMFAVSAEECIECHGGYKKVDHGKLDCVACHSDIKGLPHAGRLMKPGCASCHDEVYRVYKGTVHAKGHAANCTDCHDPHKVKMYRNMDVAGRISVCARCHGDYMEKHRWLPHAQLHFMHLECSTCHSPLSEKSMVFTINIGTRSGKRKLGYDDIAAAFGPGKPAAKIVDVNADGRVVSSELASFFAELGKRTGGNVSVSSSIVVTRSHHDYSKVERKEKVCAACHSHDAPFYRSMYLAVPGRDRLSYVPVKGTVLSALPSSLVVNTFLLGEARVNWKDIKAFLGAGGEARREIAVELGFKWIDLAGMFLCLAALFLVCVHIIIRVVFKR